MVGFTRSPVIDAMLAVCATCAAVLVSPAPAQAGTATPRTATPRTAAIVAATILVDGSLNVRDEASSLGDPIATLDDGDTVMIACRVVGQYVRGSVHNTAQWDRLTSGDYITHAYVVTDTAIPPCPPRQQQPPPPAQRAVVVNGPTGAMTEAQFVAASVAPARRSQREWRVPASVTIAQAILESGWGRSGLATDDRNYFGMKCFGQGSIAIGCREYGTVECDPLGHCGPAQASFRSYASVLDSFRDHGRLLATADRYAAAFAYVKDPDQFIAEVWAAGYATSPTYAQDVQRIMHDFGLYRYDLR